MTQLTLASLFLLASHFGIASTRLRPILVARLGEKAYLGLYSLIALVALVWLVLAWRVAPYVHLWQAGPGLRWLVLLLMPIPALLVVYGLSSPNPMAVGQERLLEDQGPAKGIQRITRHPFLWGVGLWAVLHMLANGDLASLMFFATFAVLAIAGAWLIDEKRAAAAPEAWKRYAEMTSSLPLLAVAQGHQRLVWSELDLKRAAAALALYLLLLPAHPWLFGASALP